MSGVQKFPTFGKGIDSMTRQRLVTFGMAIAVIGVLSLVCLAAPLLPKRKILTNEIYSLAQIDTMKVSCETKSALLKAQGLKIPEVQSQIEDLLAEGDLDIARKGDEVPTFNLLILTQTDLQFGGVVSVTYHVSIEQPALIRRLEEEIVVPTYALVHSVLVNESELIRKVGRPIPALVNHVLKRLDAANTELAGKRRADG